MGRLILCKSKNTSKAYTFKLTGYNIYSFEELLYYIYLNLETLIDDFPDIELLHWIGDELQLHDIEEYLLAMKGLGRKPNEILYSFISKQDYVNEKEKQNIKSRIEMWKKKSQLEKLFDQADVALRYNKFTIAARIYLSVIENEEFNQPLLKSRALHNFGVIRARMFEIASAKKYFRKAYDINSQEKSLTMYLYCMLQLKEYGKLKEELEKAIEMFDSGMIWYIYGKYYDSVQEIDNAANAFNKAKEKSPEIFINMAETKRNTEDYIRIEKAAVLKQEGKIGDYYKLIDILISKWKQEYRNSMS